MGARSFNKNWQATILNTGTFTRWISCAEFEDMVALLIEAPATLPETITFQVNTARDGSGTTTVLQDDTPADLAGPTAGKARFYNQLLHAISFRLLANGAVAADRVFTFSGQWTA